MAGFGTNLWTYSIFLGTSWFLLFLRDGRDVSHLAMSWNVSVTRICNSSIFYVSWWHESHTERYNLKKLDNMEINLLAWAYGTVLYNAEYTKDWLTQLFHCLGTWLWLFVGGGNDVWFTTVYLNVSVTCLQYKY